LWKRDCGLKDSRNKRSSKTVTKLNYLHTAALSFFSSMECFVGLDIARPFHEAELGGIKLDTQCSVKSISNFCLNVTNLQRDKTKFNIHPCCFPRSSCAGLHSILYLHLINISHLDIFSGIIGELYGNNREVIRELQNRILGTIMGIIGSGLLASQWRLTMINTHA